MKNNNLQLALKYIDYKCQWAINNKISPGAVVSVTNFNKDLFVKGYGVSDIKRNIPMTPKTTLLLASVSKPISGTLVSVLQRKYSDVNIINKRARIPMIDNYLSRNLTVKDLISHRSGIPVQYGTYQESLRYSRNEIIRNLRNVPNSGFRNTYNYTNLPFTEGVEIAANSVGLSLEKAYQYLFDLIGMSNTSIDYHPNKYKGYVDTRLLGPESDCIWYPIFKYNVTEQVSAGGIYSDAIDMNKFMRFHLEQLATSEDRKLVDPLFYSGVFVNPEDDIISNPEDDTIAGLGINISYRPFASSLVKYLSYSGALENVRTSFRLSSYLNIGIFVGTNSSPNSFPEALIGAFYSVLAGASFEEADTIFENTARVVLADISPEFCKLSDQAKGTPIADSSKFSGIYTNNVQMDFEITRDGMIKLGKLPPVKLLRIDCLHYQFILYNKQNMPFEGSLRILPDHSIELTYMCLTAIYKKRK